LAVAQHKVFGVMAEEVAKHVDHENHGADSVKCGGSDCIPKALCIYGAILEREKT
jgi:hypothetical protein